MDHPEKGSIESKLLETNDEMSQDHVDQLETTAQSDESESQSQCMDFVFESSSESELQVQSTEMVFDSSGESGESGEWELINNSGCCNANCQSIEGAKLLVAPPYVLSVYRYKPIKGQQQPLICEVCRNLVDIYNENTLVAIQDEELVFNIETPKVSNDTIDISDSDSSGAGDSDEPSFSKPVVDMLNEDLTDVFNSALRTYAVSQQLQEGRNLATLDMKKAKKDIQEASVFQENLEKRFDKLRNNFYDTFANRYTMYRIPVEIVDNIGPEGVMHLPAKSTKEEVAGSMPSGNPVKGVAIKRVTQIPRDAQIRNMLPPPNPAGMEVSVLRQVQSANQAVPPLGVLQRPPLKMGDYLYVMKNGIFGTWLKGQIDEIVPIGRPVRVYKPSPSTVFTSCVSYRVRFALPGKAYSMKTVNSKQLAYTTPSAVRYPVGTRVIAVYRDIDVPPGSFYVGIVAEPPKEVNKYRYLIFFDDGYTQYVPHKDILLVTEASKNVYEDVHVGSRDFIKQYLENFPERPMLKLALSQVIKTEWNGKWWLAKVFELDCSLCNMHFLADSRTEWMYRGSTRLAPLYKLTEAPGRRKGLVLPPPMKTERMDHAKIPRPIPGVKIQELIVPNTAGPKKPDPPSPPFAAPRGAVFLSFPSPPVSPMRETDKLANTEQTDKLANTEQTDKLVTTEQTDELSSPSRSIGAGRAVAKKSTSARPAYMSAAILPSGNKAPAQSKYANNVPGGIKHEIYNSAIKHQPKKFLPHQCTRGCIASIPYMPDSMKHCGALTVPLLNGWQRQIVKYKNKKAITYRAPCGRRIRNGDELSRYLRITKSLMGVDYFDFSYWVSCLDEFVVERSYLNIKDLSDGKEYMPIPCVNYIDHSYPDVMEYSATRQPVAGVFLNLDPEFLTGCDCVDGCVNKDKCSCWQLTFAGTDYTQSGVVDNTIGYNHKRLTEPVLTGIYECNSRCKCSSTCSNRVVQNPLRAKLQVFKTPDKGWGIRTINDMPQGSFICIYAGRLLSDNEANEEGKVCGDEYLAELDYIEVVERLKEGYEKQVKELFGETEFDGRKEKNEDENAKPNAMEVCNTVPMNDVVSRLRTRRGTTKDINRKIGVKEISKRRKRGRQPKRTTVEDEEENTEAVKQVVKRVVKPHQGKSTRHYFNQFDMAYIMDAKVSGNIGRYLNHACTPNVFVQNVFVDTHDLRFPWVAFFAQTFIRAGTELTWDYSYEIGSVPNKTLYCRCDSVECRGRLL